MPSANFTFYQDFKEQLGKKEHNLSSDVIKIALAAAALPTGWALLKRKASGEEHR